MGGTYLYGIIEGSHQAVPAIAGVDGSSPVDLVAHDGLGCVVSCYQGQDWEALSREGLVRCLLAHQRVVERFMGHRTVLPVKFGTFLRNRGEVLDLLSQGHADFTQALTAIRGRVEIEVAATWDMNRVLSEIGREAEVARARESLAQRGPVTVEERVQLGQMVKAHLDQRRDSYRERMLGLLRPLSVDVAVNALVSDELVMNVAFLVEREQERQFYAGVEHLDRLFQSEITFRVIAPLPPYSFSTVEVTRLTREQVAEARQTLHLGGDISEAEVKKAYRRLSAGMHRQLLSGDRLATEQFTRLRQAAQVVLGYCRARSGEGGQARAGNCADNLFVIPIRRSSSDEVEPARYGALDGVWP